MDVEGGTRLLLDVLGNWSHIGFVGSWSWEKKNVPNRFSSFHSGLEESTEEESEEMSEDEIPAKKEPPAK